jgi:hypothetical protein
MAQVSSWLIDTPVRARINVLGGEWLARIQRVGESSSRRCRWST